MTEIYRINEKMMETLEPYMDSDIREEVHFRYAPCTNEEFLSMVFIRGGITEEVIEEVLNINFEEIERAFKVIEAIKGYMHCNNILNYAKMCYPMRALWEEQSEKGREYRSYLDLFCLNLEVLKNEIGEENVVLSDLQGVFPEIDVILKQGFVFYAWECVLV